MVACAKLYKELPSPLHLPLAHVCEGFPDSSGEAVQIPDLPVNAENLEAATPSALWIGDDDLDIVGVQ